MKPKTKIQKQAEELSKRLRPLPRYLLDKFNRSTDKCNRTYHYAVLEQVKDFSVVRYFKYIKHAKKEDVSEFMQVWISGHGNAVRARQRFSFGQYYDTFVTGSPIETRTNRRNYFYNRLTDISFSQLFVRSRKAEKVICNYKEKQYYMVGQNYVWLTDDLDIDKFPFLETIMKQRPRIAELLLLNHLQREQDIVKLAWKHGYLTEDLDYNLWKDTVSMAQQLHLDMHNPFYVCPDNLQHAHDMYAHRLARQRRQEEEQRASMLAMSDKQGQEYFKNFIKNFVSLLITDGTITIQPLKSIKEFLQEGKMMHHCVFAMGYYKKPDTLILSAQVNGEHMETIEVDLKNFHIVQSRGKCNQPSNYHEKIRTLLNENMNKIKQLTKKERKTA